MDLDIVIGYALELLKKVPQVLPVLWVLGSAMTVIRAKVKATESNEDDTALANLEAKPLFGVIIKVVEKFSLLKVKEE